MRMMRAARAVRIVHPFAACITARKDGLTHETAPQLNFD